MTDDLVPDDQIEPDTTAGEDVPDVRNDEVPIETEVTLSTDPPNSITEAGQ